jgi:hypothetical protein
MTANLPQSFQREKFSPRVFIHFAVRNCTESMRSSPERTSLMITNWSPGMVNLFSRKNLSAI